MKKIAGVLLAALLALLPAAGVWAETMFEGSVTAAETVSVTAPYGGVTENIRLRPGDAVHVGDSLMTVETTRVYAPADGKVSGIFAQEGDDTAGIATRYGAVMYIEPTRKYTVAADTDKAYNSSETKFVHIGESVQLACTADGSHKGRGIITGIDSASTKYTIEVTSGEFYMGETVNVFRNPDAAAKTRVGRGTISRTAPIAVTGTGSVLKIHVENGDLVERGQLLYETVDGALDGLYAGGNEVICATDGIVATVDATNGTAVVKDAKLMSIYPADSMQIEIPVSESDLALVPVGANVRVEFEFDGGGTQLAGTVSGVSFVSRAAAAGEGAAAASSTDVTYTAYVAFTPTPGVRLGMTAIVTLDDQAGAAETPADAQ